MQVLQTHNLVHYSTTCPIGSCFVLVASPGMSEMDLQVAEESDEVEKCWFLYG